MSYDNSSAEFRPELHAVVEQAMAIDNKFIADQIFPVMPVETDTGDYMRILRGKGQLLSNPSGAAGNTDATDPLVRAPGGEYREVTRTEEKDSWKTVDRGLEEPIDDKLKQKVARFYDKESSTAKLLMRSIRISREARVAAKVFDESKLGTAIDGTGVPFIEANIATIDFAAYLSAAKLKIEKRQEDANTLVISGNMWDLVTRSTKLREFFFGTAGGNSKITKQLLAEKFELSQILIGKSSFDTTKVGKAATDNTLVWTWSDLYFAVLNVQSGAPENGGIGRTFCLEEMTGGQLFVTESYRIEKRRCTMIRVRQDDDTKIVNENSGVLVKINT